MSHYIEIDTCTVQTCIDSLLAVPVGTYVLAPLPDGIVHKFTMKLRYHVFKHGYRLKTRKEGRRLRMWIVPMTPRQRSEYKSPNWQGKEQP